MMTRNIRADPCLSIETLLSKNKILIWVICISSVVLISDDQYNILGNSRISIVVVSSSQSWYVHSFSIKLWRPRFHHPGP